ncbi:cache domain-containing sensor histidine kinase [Paenibacillus physcomitrellae]|uniref:Histidine kinase n=1 Tax=Paenibacillus physcomitrellae TaxID=1619311 RepID=A0ABQ1GBD1_9BACL|nr:sensor histidine kinase [Paenibacillus physcomitrellae]GGA40408.1 histidine kinase [Paenibacillus physcomitrellae]
MKFNFNHVRLRGKMLILYTIAVFIPIVVTNIVFYQVTTHNVKQQKINDMSKAMEQIRNEFLAQIDVAVGISSILYTDNLLNDAIEKKYETPSDYIDSYYATISPTLYRYSPIYKAIQNISIYTNNSSVIGGGGILPITSGVRQEPWYRAVMQTTASSPVVVRSINYTYKGPETTYTVVRKLNYYKYQNLRTKVLKIDISLDTVSGLFRNSTLQGKLYLVNDAGIIDYATAPELDWQARGVSLKQLSIPSHTIIFKEDFNNVNYLRGWHIEGHFPENELLKDVYRSRNFVLYLAIPNLLVPTLFIIWFTRSFNRRIIRILKHMKKVKNHHFETIKHEQYPDEIGQLTDEFNRMTLQIRKLIDDVYIADIQRKDLELKRKQAQLHALQSQINPHFLFNALETIRMRSLLKKEAETAKIIHNMAKIFRKSLTWGRDLVFVREELELIHCFLEIQKYRFGDKLEYEVDIDEAAYGCLIPKMTILPFVENASIHGIEPLKEGGRITLRIWLEDAKLIAEVKDNGAGIGQDQLAEIRHSLANEEAIGEHIGIRNAYYRLKLNYREQLYFMLNSSTDEGTNVRIELPDVQEEVLKEAVD